MTVVESVEGRANQDGAVELDARFPGGGYGVRVADPFAGDPAGEELLAWHFQERLKSPFKSGASPLTMGDKTGDDMTAKRTESVDDVVRCTFFIGLMVNRG